MLIYDVSSSVLVEYHASKNSMKLFAKILLPFGVGCNPPPDFPVCCPLGPVRWGFVRHVASKLSCAITWIWKVAHSCRIRLFRSATAERISGLSMCSVRRENIILVDGASFWIVEKIFRRLAIVSILGRLCAGIWVAI